MEFQSYAYGKNHWLLEPDLRSILLSYHSELSNWEPQFSAFGQVAGGKAYEMADQIDRAALPELIMYDLDGRRVDRARLDPAHASLLKELAWINQPPYEGGSWHTHFTLGYLLADTGLYCSIIVTNQTAYAIYKYAPEQKSWLEPLLCGDAWGATWMTEVHGGSDLGANRTRARHTPQGWHLDGDDKYFASNAGLADLAVVTARPEGAPAGPKGLALFLVPRLDETGQLNYRVRRLKRKSATRAVPTGEIEFSNSQAYLVGEARLGIYYTMENLTVSRLANAVGAMGLAHKARLEALYRMQHRRAFGEKLIDQPLIRRDLTDIAVRMAGGLALAFHAVEAFDQSWQATPPYTPDYHHARFLSHLAKNRTADHATAITQMVMELFGGAGFLEDYAISRLHREALVTPIWEGGSNIQALDFIEAIIKKSAHESFLDEMIPLLEAPRTPEATQTRQAVETSLTALASLSPKEIQWNAKQTLTTLADAAQVALLYRLAGKVGGDHYARMAELYAHHFILHKEYPSWAMEAEGIWNPIELQGIGE